VAREQADQATRRRAAATTRAVPRATGRAGTTKPPHIRHYVRVDSEPIFVIEGSRVRTLDDFWTVIGEAVNGTGGYFASGLDALDDALSGGMGTPEDGRCAFVWRDSALSRAALGYPETVRQLELRLARCHPSNRARVRADISRATAGEGPTAFDWIVESFAGRPTRLVLG
jgi:hypothetical protein